MTFRWTSHLAGRHRGAMIGGAVALLLGLFVMVMPMLDPSWLSEGVPLWIGVSAGAVFFLSGLLVLGSATRGAAAGDLATTILTAVLVTAFAAVSTIFPPGAIFVVYFAVLCWIAVYRQVHARVTGRDPLAGLSDRRQLGLGCAVTIALILLAVLVAWIIRNRPPAEGLLLERMQGRANTMRLRGAGFIGHPTKSRVDSEIMPPMTSRSGIPLPLAHVVLGSPAPAMRALRS